MKISALRLFNVKRFANRGVAIEDIGDGVNVLCAANEFGKSTSFEALHALFFQPYSGTPGDVQRLRPYSSGNPLIEADITTAEGRFRITKQYYGGRSARIADLATGRLVAQADEAENFIAGLIKGGPAGPAGLLWVRQGVTGLEKRSKSEEESEKQVRASLLESVQGEVEAITGGRRMAEIMDAVNGELDKMVTKRGPKAGERYDAAIKERDRLATQEQELSAQVSALRAALDSRTSAVKRLAELDNAEEREARDKAIERAQAAHDAAKAQNEKLKAAEAELALVRDRRNNADQKLKTFRDALQKANELQGRRREAEHARDEAVSRRHAVAEAAEKARLDAETAEIKEQEARDLLTRLDAALKAREAAQRLDELKARLSRAEAARQAIEEGEATLALLTIPPGAIDELQALEIEIATIRAREEAARPSVAIAYETDTASRVTMDGTPLMAGEERGYGGQAQLLVPGIGTITLRSNRPAPTDNRLDDAEAKRQTLLASMGVADLASARAQQSRAQQMDAEVRELQGRLSLLAPEGLPQLRKDVATYGSIDSEALELKADPVQVQAALAGAEDRRKEARLVLREIQPLQARAGDAFVAAETTLASLQAELAQAEAILGPEKDRDQREQALSTDLDELERRLADAEAGAGKLRADAADLDSREATLKRVRSVRDAAEKEAATLRETIAGLNAEIRARSDEAVEEKWRETIEALSAAKTRVEAFEKEVAVLQRLSAALEAARSQARDLYLRPVITELTPLLGLLFDDVAITFDDRTLLPQTIRRNGQEEEVDRLSGGMREQLSVLTRLAFARLLARDGRPAPVILDDALVYSDDDRIERMFDALHRQSRDQQIIVFSCRQRAFQKLGGHTLQMTDWQP
ncbi:MAG: DNA-binding protein [Xanthobacteraceae bacterium]